RGAATDLPARAVRPGPGRERDQPPRALRDAGQARRACRRATLPLHRLMRVERELVVNAPREQVWDYITDPANYTLFFSGITRRAGCSAGSRISSRRRWSAATSTTRSRT